MDFYLEQREVIQIFQWLRWMDTFMRRVTFRILANELKALVRELSDSVNILCEFAIHGFMMVKICPILPFCSWGLFVCLFLRQVYVGYWQINLEHLQECYWNTWPKINEISPQLWKEKTDNLNGSRNINDFEAGIKLKNKFKFWNKLLE